MPAYKVRKRLVSIGRDYNVEDESGKAVFRVDGKVGFARKFIIKDNDGNALLAVREKLLSIDPLFVIKRDTATIATVRRRSHGDEANTKFDIEINGTVAMKATGSFLRDGVRFTRDGVIVGSISRTPLTVIEEIFEMQVVTSEDLALVVAIAMSIVEMVPFRGEDRS